MSRDKKKTKTKNKPTGLFVFLIFNYFFAILMPFDLDTLCCNHAWSGEQTGESVEEAGDADDEPTVGTQLGNPTGEFAFTSTV